MKIAVQAADLDSKRIDGTRVYLLNMLRRFGKLSLDDNFFIYHKGKFNPKLSPPEFSNYHIKSIKFPFYWTQTRFSWEMLLRDYDRLWMPMQALPFIKHKSLISTVTIHDLAFKYFPHFFPKEDLRRLNLFTGVAIRKSDKIIAVSESTKKDILKFYPEIKEDKIKVIYHGFDSELFQRGISREEKNKILANYKLQTTNYILYVGALQPRKNLKKLIEAFELAKKNNSELKLVLAGGKAWMWEDIFKKAEKSEFKKDIIITGTIGFEEIKALYKNSAVFVFPSLYEGFGIPVLEAQASGVPVVAGDNSSIPEVVNDSAILTDVQDAKKIAEAIEKVLSDDNLRQNLISRGYENVKRFSWDECAKETLEYIKF